MQEHNIYDRCVNSEVFIFSEKQNDFVRSGSIKIIDLPMPDIMDTVNQIDHFGQELVIENQDLLTYLSITDYCVKPSTIYPVYNKEVKL